MTGAVHHTQTRVLAVAVLLLAAVALPVLAAGPAAERAEAAASTLDRPATQLAAAGASLAAARGDARTSEASLPPTYLWVLTARTGTTRRIAPSRFVLTLRGVDPAVVQFTDRPWRKAYVLHVRDFAHDWKMWFSDAEPNAVLSYLEPGSARPLSIVVELSRPRYTHGVLRLQARRIFRQHDLLPGAATPVALDRPRTPPRFTGASLFVDGAGPAASMHIGELMLFAGNYTPPSFMTADGTSLPIQTWTTLYAAVAMSQGAGSGSFTLPQLSTTWPAGAFLGGHGRWVVNTMGVFPTEFADYDGVLPSQVVFTIVDPYWAAYYTDLTSSIGAADLGIGDLLGVRASAYALPGVGFGSAYVGELRLFAADAALPAGWVPADGRWLTLADYMALHAVLAGASDDPWGQTSSDLRVPDVAAPDGYRWAISCWGIFPAPQ